MCRLRHYFRRLLRFCFKKSIHANMNRGSYAKHWVFTWFDRVNITVDEFTSTVDASLSALEDNVPDAIEFAVAQGERCPDTGRFHLQGHLCFAQRSRFPRVVRFLQGIGLGKAHVEASKSPADSIKYCQKAESRVSGPYKFGVVPETIQGKRSDLHRVADAILQDGASELQVAMKFPTTYMKYSNGIAKLTNMAPMVRSEHTRVLFFSGPPGTGKTLWAQWVASALVGGDTSKVYYKVPGPWWPMYEPNEHEVVIWDEWGSAGTDHETRCPTVRTLLNLCGSLPYQVPVKGSYKQFRPRFLIVTSNFSLAECYKQTPQWDAVARRFHLQDRVEPNWEVRFTAGHRAGVIMCATVVGRTASCTRDGWTHLPVFECYTQITPWDPPLDYQLSYAGRWYTESRSDGDSDSDDEPVGPSTEALWCSEVVGKPHGGAVAEDPGNQLMVMSMDDSEGSDDDEQDGDDDDEDLTESDNADAYRTPKRRPGPVLPNAPKRGRYSVADYIDDVASVAGPSYRRRRGQDVSSDED